MTAEGSDQTGTAGTPLSVVGHDGAEGDFMRAFRSGRLAHGWLVAGPRGIGKSILASRMAAHVLCDRGAPPNARALFPGDAMGKVEFDTNDPAIAQILSRSHPDLMAIQRQTSPETGKLQKEIGVDAVRRVGAFLRLTPAAGGWRAVIVDSADELTHNAANALLKVLEEPPSKVLIILISHSPRRLLPTIRSRCRLLQLVPLSQDQTRVALSHLAPEADAEDLDLAAALADGCPGRGVDLLGGDGLSLFREVSERLRNLPEIDFKAVDALGDSVARAKEDRPFRHVFEILEWWLSHLVRTAATTTPAGWAHGPDGAAWQRLAQVRSLEHWLEVWDKINRLRTRTEAANLDRKQAIISAFNLLEAAARP